MLRAIDGYEGQPAAALALRLTPHVFVRPGELCAAEWTESDLTATVWTIPGEEMKMGRPHRVPLSKQVLALVTEVREVRDEYLNTHWFLSLGQCQGQDQGVAGGVQREPTSHIPGVLRPAEFASPVGANPLR
ncbi:hypothetical protein DD559_05745 [Sphingomonas pokkalii]|uniref:Tyr recombinase domain-containing protein n=1 Tax=Sphingomonas pokkalii TaxID=2175090 RepID=A0A2U0SBZ8_9SPHN|nr:hypothetical protein DD559_05745 [Sphingomonas pokkalii]